MKTPNAAPMSREEVLRVLDAAVFTLWNDSGEEHAAPLRRATDVIGQWVVLESPVTRAPVLAAQLIKQNEELSDAVARVTARASSFAQALLSYTNNDAKREPDHACVRCFPDAKNPLPGFECPHHRAVSFLNSGGLL